MWVQINTTSEGGRARIVYVWCANGCALPRAATAAAARSTRRLRVIRGGRRGNPGGLRVDDDTARVVASHVAFARDGAAKDWTPTE